MLSRGQFTLFFRIKKHSRFSDKLFESKIYFRQVNLNLKATAVRMGRNALKIQFISESEVRTNSLID